MCKNDNTVFLGCEVGIDSRMIKPRQNMIDVLVPADLKWSDEIEFDQRCYAELLVIMAQLNNGIKLVMVILCVNNSQKKQQWRIGLPFLKNMIYLQLGIRKNYRAFELEI